MTKTAFILAAGQGTRLRPYTNNIPKPMVSVAGKPIIEHIMDKLKSIGVSNIIINLYYLGDVIKKYFKNSNFIFSNEDKILDTGGGVKHALTHIKEDSFFLINGDAFWVEDDDYNALETLNNSWNPDKMDILLLLQPINKMKLTQGIGDYDIDSDGRAIRSLNKTGVYMFAGIRLTKKSVIENINDDVFSFLKCMDIAEKNGKLFGLISQCNWHHISTPDDLKSVNHALGFQTPEPAQKESENEK